MTDRNVAIAILRFVRVAGVRKRRHKAVPEISHGNVRRSGADCLIEMNCEDCGTEVPLDSIEEIREWIRDNAEQIWEDELMFGSSFQCATCGARKDPTKMVIATPKADKSFFGQSIIESQEK